MIPFSLMSNTIFEPHKTSLRLNVVDLEHMTALSTSDAGTLYYACIWTSTSEGPMVGNGSPESLCNTSHSDRGCRKSLEAYTRHRRPFLEHGCGRCVGPSRLRKRWTAHGDSRGQHGTGTSYVGSSNASLPVRSQVGSGSARIVIMLPTARR